MTSASSASSPPISASWSSPYVVAWPWPQAQIAGISLSTTSVAVVYAVMVETGFNRTEIGKIILAACFVNDLGTVLALGIVFAHFNGWLALFVAVDGRGALAACRGSRRVLPAVGHRVSEPETKFISARAVALGGLATRRRQRGGAARLPRRHGAGAASSPTASCRTGCASSRSRCLRPSTSSRRARWSTPTR